MLSLKLAESRSDLIVVLSEFARECQEDMSLKLLAFETLDVFIVLQAVCRGALFQSDAATRDTFMRPDLLWTSCLGIAAFILLYV